MKGSVAYTATVPKNAARVLPKRIGPISIPGGKIYMADMDVNCEETEPRSKRSVHYWKKPQR